MADNPKLRGIPDSKLVSLTQDHEVAYWTGVFGVTKKQLTEAVALVGHSVGKLKVHFDQTA